MKMVRFRGYQDMDRREIVDPGAAQKGSLQAWRPGLPATMGKSWRCLNPRSNPAGIKIHQD
jgi:hypothetical protein